MSYYKEVIYPPGTEVLYDPYSDYEPLNGDRAFIGVVREAPNPKFCKPMYTLIVSATGLPGTYSMTTPREYYKYVSRWKVMTPDDYVKYRENIRVDINLRRALRGEAPDQRMEEDYVQWVINAYERSEIPF